MPPRSSAFKARNGPSPRHLERIKREITEIVEEFDKVPKKDRNQFIIALGSEDSYEKILQEIVQEKIKSSRKEQTPGGSKSSNKKRQQKTIVIESSSDDEPPSKKPRSSLPDPITDDKHDPITGLIDPITRGKDEDTESSSDEDEPNALADPITGKVSKQMILNVAIEGKKKTSKDEKEDEEKEQESDIKESRSKKPSAAEKKERLRKDKEDILISRQLNSERMRQAVRRAALRAEKRLNTSGKGDGSALAEIKTWIGNDKESSKNAASNVDSDLEFSEDDDDYLARLTDTSSGEDGYTDDESDDEDGDEEVDLEKQIELLDEEDKRARERGYELSESEVES